MKTNYQDDFNCGASSQADFIMNYFLSNCVKYPLKFSISFQSSWQAGTIKATLPIITIWSRIWDKKHLQANYLMWRAAAASMAYMNEVEQKRQFSFPKFLLTQSKGRGQDQFKILKEADREVRRAAKVA